MSIKPRKKTDDPSREIFPKIAQNYDLPRAQIVNAMTYSCLNAIEEKTVKLSTHNLLKALKIEFQKEERMFVQLNKTPFIINLKKLISMLMHINFNFIHV